MPPYSIRHLHVDHLGSTRVVTQDYSIVSTHDYFPFGEEIQPVFDYATKRFTGHERDQATGLDYMLARYYVASLGRFASPDPRQGIPEDVQTWNRFSYVWNRPLSLRDTTGEYPTWASSTDDRFAKTFWFVRWFGRGRPGAKALREGAEAALDNLTDASYAHRAQQVLDGDSGEAAEDPRGGGRYGATLMDGEVVIFYRDNLGNEWGFTIEENDEGNTLHLKYYRAADGEEAKEGDAPDPPQCGGPCPIETKAEQQPKKSSKAATPDFFGGPWLGTSAFGNPPDHAYDPRRPGFCPVCGP